MKKRPYKEVNKSHFREEIFADNQKDISDERLEESESDLLGWKRGQVKKHKKDENLPEKLNLEDSFEK